mmetsp:Transcript_4214/g.10130  ORF Transcript_4214/g.10130 Transcript_4214/m.10130 type:complete len:136 (+) Transcript_4214:1252-1659(+)
MYAKILAARAAMFPLVVFPDPADWWRSADPSMHDFPPSAPTDPAVKIANGDLADAVGHWVANFRVPNTNPKEEVYRFQAILNGIAAIRDHQLLITSAKQARDQVVGVGASISKVVAQILLKPAPAAPVPAVVVPQ